MRKLTALSATALGLAVALAGPARASDDIAGLWMTPEDDGAILIEPCESGLCGRIVWLSSPLDENGQPVRDENNADISRRALPLCGTEVIHGARPDGDGWSGGTIYDPETGSSYSLAMQRRGEALMVTGFVGLKAFGQTFAWHRAPAALKRCDAPAAPLGKGPRPAGKGA